MECTVPRILEEAQLPRRQLAYDSVINSGRSANHNHKYELRIVYFTMYVQSCSSCVVSANTQNRFKGRHDE